LLALVDDKSADIAAVRGPDGVVSLGPLAEDVAQVGAQDALEGVLGVLTARQLPRPREISIKVHLIQASEAVLLVEDVSPLEGGVRCHTRRNRVSSMVVIVESAVSEEVVPRVACLGQLVGLIWRVANEHVNDDLRIIIDEVSALADGTLDIGVIDSHTVHKDANVVPVVGWEEARDR